MRKRRPGNLSQFSKQEVCEHSFSISNKGKIQIACDVPKEGLNCDFRKELGERERE
jgi:hypothetical protein